MKKLSNTKKVIVVVCILTLALFIFPLSSFAKGGKGGKKGGGNSLICAFEGDITGLVFDFGDGFTLDFGVFEAAIRSVELQASGQETTVVIPPKQFIYNASLSAGWDGSDNGKILANATLEYEDGFIEEDVTLEFEFGFANLFEQFDIKKKDTPDACPDLLDVPVPKKVDLFFEVTYVRLTKIISPGSVEAVIAYESFFNLVLAIDNGKLVLVESFKFLPLPPIEN